MECFNLLLFVYLEQEIQAFGPALQENACHASCSDFSREIEEDLQGIAKEQGFPYAQIRSQGLNVMLWMYFIGLITLDVRQNSWCF